MMYKKPKIEIMFFRDEDIVRSSEGIVYDLWGGEGDSVFDGD